MVKSIENKQGRVTIGLAGNINSTNARELQNDLTSRLDKLDDIESIVVDASELEYISSLGLRTLLWLKKEYENVTIVDVVPNVYNVLKMTGFTKMMSVTQALPSYSLDGLTPLHGGEGYYMLSDDSVLKVFPEDVTKEYVQAEVALAKAIFVLGVVTTMAFEIVRVGKGYGIVYEYLDAQTITDPVKLGKYLRHLHSIEIDEEGDIPSVSEKIKSRIQKLATCLGDDAVEKLLQLLTSIPVSHTLLAGNPSLQNILEQDGELVLTDVEYSGYGNHIIDLAYLYTTLDAEKRGEFFDSLLDEYYEMESTESISKTRERIEILSLLFDFVRLSRLTSISDDEAEKYRNKFQTQIADRWDELLSRLKFKMDFHEEIRMLERKKFYLDSEVDIDWVARKLSTNRHYVSDFFNKVLHVSFNEYISNLRLEYARHLLLVGKAKANEVAYDAGFNNEHTFRRLFKQKYGCSPSQYKG